MSRIETACIQSYLIMQSVNSKVSSSIVYRLYNIDFRSKISI